MQSAASRGYPEQAGSDMLSHHTLLGDTMRALYIVGLMIIFGFFVNAAPVQAQSAIVYVSASGNNNNPCTFALPCRTLQKAVNVVPSGGVVQVPNSAAYGNVTIAKFVTISG